jgi:hypothetical protein
MEIHKNNCGSEEAIGLGGSKDFPAGAWPTKWTNQSLERRAQSVTLFCLPPEIRSGIDMQCAGDRHEMGPERRLPVFQSGREIGTVPDSFDPRKNSYTSVLYDAREGDFSRGTEGWIADVSLGPGDLEAVAGFKWL